MKILVTGHRGFIGKNLLTKLSTKGHHVVGYEYGDILPDLEGYDWVIHAGAISSTTETNVNKVLDQNFNFTCDLLDRCISKKVNFQFSSSASVYGLGKEFYVDAPYDPKTPYAWSKVIAEQYLKRKFNSNIKIQCFRYFNVFGPFEEHKGNQASPFCQFTKQAKETGKIKVFKNSEIYFRDFIHVEEVVRMHERFFTVDESGIWNLGTGSARSFMDVAWNIAKENDAEIVTIDMPENLKNSYQEYTCADMTETYNTLARHGS